MNIKSLLAVLLVTISFGAFSEEDPFFSEEIPLEKRVLLDKCSIKSGLFQYIVEARGTVAERDTELQEIIDTMTHVYEKGKAHYKYHEYVDSLRVSRDAYRLTNYGEYRVTDPVSFGMMVFTDCVKLGF